MNILAFIKRMNTYTVSCVFRPYWVIFSSFVVGLTKCINSRSPLQLILQLISAEKAKFYVQK